MSFLREIKSGKYEEILKEISKKEKIDEDKLRRRILKGYIVVVKNFDRNIKPIAIGKGTRVKVNANVGTSPDFVDIKEEVEKAKIAIDYGADTIMDLSIGGDLDKIRRELLKLNVPLGTVPIYQAGIEANKKFGSISDMNEDLVLNVIEKHFKEVDFVTLHASITKELVEKYKKVERLTGIVSRGGSFIYCYIIKNNDENPIFKNFEYILEIAKEYNVTISLGDSFRPGSLFDLDELYYEELIVTRKLVKKAREKDVQVIVEGPGHVRFDKIPNLIRFIKRITYNVPLYTLGPLVTDIAAGYDHIASAIGAALAAFYGADFICYVTPAEHLSLPTKEDVILGVISAKIAAHSIDIIRGKDIELDYMMSKARGMLNWNEQLKYTIDRKKFLEYRNRRKTLSDACSMCGKYCAMKLSKKIQ